MQEEQGAHTKRPGKVRGMARPHIVGVCERCGISGVVRQEARGKRHLSCQECRRERRELLAQFRLPRGAYMKQFDHERAQGMVERYRLGDTLADIGESVGLTRERIRQIIRREVGDTGLGALKREHSATIMDARAEVKRAAFLHQPVSKCAVCWAPTRRRIKAGKARVTCGAKCADIWRGTRHRLGGMPTHRDSMARWVLKHPEKATKYATSWANRYFAGESKVGPERPQADSQATKNMEWVKEQRAENSRFWEGDTLKGGVEGSVEGSVE